MIVRSSFENGKGRPEPTFYATEDDVRKAIRKLSRAGLSPAVVAALDTMSGDNYRFRLFDKSEQPAREVVQKYFPEFTQAVFDLIPEGRKFKKNWEAGVDDIAVHSNRSGIFLHARPTGIFLPNRETYQNPLRSLEIYQG